MKKYLLFLLVFPCFFISCSERKDSVQFKAMDTYITITSYGKNAKKANKKARERIEEIEKIISTTIPESEVHKINQYDVQNSNDLTAGKTLKKEQGDFEKIHLENEETKNLIEYSLKMAEKTDGALNPALYPIVKLWGFTTGNYKVPDENELNSALKKTDFTKVRILEEFAEDAKPALRSSEKNRPEQDFLQSPPADLRTEKKYYLLKAPGMMIDFGAVGKGFAGDEAIKVLKEFGIKSALLDLGGNIQTLGAKPDGSEWNIGVKNPWEAANPVAGVKAADKSVITSGGYERFFFDKNGKKYIHIFDSKNGRPVENELESVTVIASSGLYADSLTTSLFVMGTENAIRFWKENRDFEMILITENQKFFYTSGLKDKIAVLFDFEQVSVVD